MDKGTLDIHENLLNDLAKALINANRRSFNKNINSSNIERYVDGVVTGFDGEKVLVKTAFSTDNIPILNKNKIAVTTNCKVRIYYTKQNIADGYIGAVL